ncbi:unnamed protein product [Didymodactylos carnosus]|uniref:Uncharacterized protein n=1 Tax=Didymodactylos carnosus TaxID=1234261 RepID=A0A814A605_9BILA|nr:unnamed protein product [Didymodactylos carnosus]CAF1055316.1 unnamed protein product [Didymodactylos carnosus]CAF3689326.1 unnamed protein product [Didymodactylos carnosus]CAF3821584.1 unnamed protein product [Didymodactylos carnosus]
MIGHLVEPASYSSSTVIAAASCLRKTSTICSRCMTSPLSVIRNNQKLSNAILLLRLVALQPLVLEGEGEAVKGVKGPKGVKGVKDFSCSTPFRITDDGRTNDTKRSTKYIQEPQRLQQNNTFTVDAVKAKGEYHNALEHSTQSSGYYMEN